VAKTPQGSLEAAPDPTTVFLQNIFSMKK